MCKFVHENSLFEHPTEPNVCLHNRQLAQACLQRSRILFLGFLNHRLKSDQQVGFFYPLFVLDREIWINFERVPLAFSSSSPEKTSSVATTTSSSSSSP